MVRGGIPAYSATSSSESSLLLCMNLEIDVATSHISARFCSHHLELFTV